MEVKYLLCIGTPAWEGNYQKSTLELLKELSKTYHVLYVEFPFSFLDLLRSFQRNSTIPRQRILRRKKRLRFFSQSQDRGLHVLTLPPLFPINWLPPGFLYNTFARINASMARRAIRRALKELGFEKPVVMNALQPILGRYLIGDFQESGRIYYCYDEISEAPWLSKHGTRLEKELIPLMDAVITTSEPLKRRKLSLSVPTYVVKNGVDYHLFSKAYHRRCERLKANIGPKTVGYVGSMDFRMDVNLLQYLVESRPDVYFLFVGPITDQGLRLSLSVYDNVIFAGPQQPDRLPYWLAKMDVGIIPFVNNGFTQNIYPMKINEYLAAGLAVVSTDFGDLKDFEEVITITDDAATFLTAVGEGLENRTLALARERNLISKGNSWQARVNKMEQTLDKVLQRKQNNHRQSLKRGKWSKKKSAS
ncbi:MAG: glycosyltransferase [Bacteroidota bacterium]